MRALPFKQVMYGWIYEGQYIDNLHELSKDELQYVVRIYYNRFRRFKTAFMALNESEGELKMDIYVSALIQAEREYKHVKNEVKNELKRRS